MALLTNAKKERIFGKYNFRQVALPTRVKRVSQPKGKRVGVTVGCSTDRISKGKTSCHHRLLGLKRKTISGILEGMHHASIFYFIS